MSCHSVRRTFVVFALAGVLHLFLVSPPSASAAAPAVRTSLPAVESEVMCVTCKIPLPVAQSPQASRERAFIAGLVLRGRTLAQIKSALVREYGPAVLALPPARGFGLAVYLVPPTLLLLVLLALGLLLLRSRRRARAAAASAPPPSLSPGDSARLQADMARFD
jgi:cytochrome c-type biogenesis protein CcmH